MTGCDFKNKCNKRNVFKRDWIAYSEYDHHSKLDSKHNQKDLQDHLVSMRIFTLTMNEIFI